MDRAILVLCEPSQYNEFHEMMDGIEMEYLTIREMAEKWKLSGRMINVYCAERVEGAVKKGTFG